LGTRLADLAIADALRRQSPDVEIAWLAGEPARQLIEETGETVLEESSGFDETGLIETSAGDFSLNLVDFVRRAGGAWTAAVRAFAHVVTRNRYDVMVGDEAYEVAGSKPPASVTAIYSHEVLQSDADMTQQMSAPSANTSAQFHRDDEQLVRSQNSAYLRALEQHQAGLDQMPANPTP
jgi:hypothetical protein